MPVQLAAAVLLEYALPAKMDTIVMASFLVLPVAINAILVQMLVVATLAFLWQELCLNATVELDFMILDRRYALPVQINV